MKRISFGFLLAVCFIKASMASSKIYEDVNSTTPYYEYGPVVLNTSMPNDAKSHFYTDNRGFEWGATTIYERKVDGTLSALKFSKMKIPADVHVTPDGKTLYYADYGENPGRIYKSVRRDGKWTEPKVENRLPPGSGYLTSTDGGIIYFSFKSDIYRLEDDKYKRLPENINSESAEHDPFIAQDESFLIFVREDSKGDTNMYLSLNLEGGWTKAEKLPSPFNDKKVDGSPYVTPDMKYLFFSSNRDGKILKTWQAPFLEFINLKLKSNNQK